jgi:hypothetical protein
VLQVDTVDRRFAVIQLGEGVHATYASAADQSPWSRKMLFRDDPRLFS